MLCLQLTRDALSANWRALPDGWAALGGRVRVFRHRAVEALAFGCHAACAFVVRERVGAGSVRPEAAVAPMRSVPAASFDALVAEARRWPLHHVVLEVDHRGPPEARISASDWPVAPVFLAERRGALVGSWDPLDLYPFVRDDGLDLARATRFLAAFDHPYAQGTMLAGVRCLTAGARAVWRGDRGLELAYPPPADAAYPRHVLPDADVLAAATEIRDAAIRRWLGGACRSVAVQLSGGLDSALVATTAAGLAATVRTYGLLLPGPTLSAQVERRAALIGRLGCVDTGLDATATPVLAADGPRMRRHEVVPWEEIYYEGFDRLSALAAAADDIILTGFGGDELLPLYWEEMAPDEQARRLAPAPSALPGFLTARAVELYRDTERSFDRAPRGYLQRSSQEAIAASSAHFMRHGLWAYHLFATPELVRFCHSLPKEWRAQRRLVRASLAARGFGREVTHPAVTEDFGDLFDRSLRALSRPQFERALAAERLHDLGLVDAAAVRRAYRAYCDGQAPEGVDVALYAAALLELTAIALDERSATAVIGDRRTDA